MIGTSRFTRHRVSTALALIFTAVVTTLAVLATLASQSLFNDATAHPEADGATVRISALKSESGAVRVALQQQESGGAWGERLHPDLNTVRESAQTGIWLHSSPLQVTGAEDAGDRTLYCVISHGHENDYFWEVLKAYVRKAERDFDVDVRYVASPDGREQAAAIQRCSADEAGVIAATLADPDAVTTSLLAAKANGARIVTYNSGPEHAQAAGSELHISLDDDHAGRLSGETFDEKGVTGTVACVIHEEANVGLETRCDALERTYTGGDVIRLRMPISTDTEALTRWLEQHLTDPDGPEISGILTLNANTLLVAFEAVVRTADELDRVVQLGSVGASRALQRYTIETRRQHLLFTTNNLMEAQGYLITAAMVMANDFSIPSDLISNPTILIGTPFIYNRSGFYTNPESVAELLRNAEELVRLAHEPEDD